MVIGYKIKCHIGLCCLYFLCWYNLLKENKKCFLSFELMSQIEIGKDKVCLMGENTK